MLDLRDRGLAVEGRASPPGSGRMIAELLEHMLQRMQVQSLDSKSLGQPREDTY
jgi:hypothetical protein